MSLQQMFVDRHTPERMPSSYYRQRRCVVLAKGFALATGLLFALAHAAPGMRDLSFGAGTGQVFTTHGSSSGTVRAIALQPDGKLLLATHCYSGTRAHFCFSRHTPDGELDTTFGTDGQLISSVDISTAGDYLSDVTLQPDGRFVAAGNCYTDNSFTPCLVRYSNRGALDPTFNSTGKQSVAFATAWSGRPRVATQSDGKILLATHCRDASRGHDVFCLSRFAPDGSIDYSFNSTGTQRIAIGTSKHQLSGLAVQPDGRIIVSGSCASATGANYVCVSRLLPGGEPDPSFNATGSTLSTFEVEVSAMATQPNGSVVIAGTCKPATTDQFCVVRLTSAGTPDITLNGTGEVATNFSTGYNTARAIAVQPDGKLVVAGDCQGRFCVARYAENGIPDITFNAVGSTTLNLDANRCAALSIAPQPDEKIVLAGYCYKDASDDPTVARITPDGQLDPTFNRTGYRIYRASPGDSRATAVAAQADGKIVVAGQCYKFGEAEDFCLARYTSSGTLDLTFNGSGKQIFPIGRDRDRARAVLLQPDGKIIIAGDCRVDDWSTASTFCLARLTTNGLLDASFNGTGTKLTNPYRLDYESAKAAVLQPDGKIVLVGNSSSALLLRRYTPAGALDVTLNGTGTVMLPVAAPPANIGRAIAIQSDGKIVVAGTCSTSTRFCIVRFTPEGVLDETFNGSGMLEATFDRATQLSPDTTISMTLQPDGMIVVAGTCTWYNQTVICVARATSSGELDSTFNRKGLLILRPGSGDNYAQAIAAQPDGKLLIGGVCYNGSREYFCLARHAPDGATDTSFNGTGVQMHTIGRLGGALLSIAMQPDGNVVAAGVCNDGATNEFCIVRYEGDPFVDAHCPLDIDGDQKVSPTTDSLIHMRIALGLTGPAVVDGIAFGAYATRRTWPAIRDYLSAQCTNGSPFSTGNCLLDIDGDDRLVATIDSIVHTRIALGAPSQAVLNGIQFSPQATRDTWPSIRDYLHARCGGKFLPP